MLKDALKKLLDQVLFPAIDEWVARTKFPFNLDDKIWERIKIEVYNRLDMANIHEDHRGMIVVNDVGSFNLKDALKAFIIHEVFPLIDAQTSKWSTPFELDDLTWKFLKVRIEELLNK